VVAQQLRCIYKARAAAVDKLFFEGSEIPIAPSFGIFITMNPGYAGRITLPDNLTAMCRPVSMMVPGYGIIAEVMFLSEGFKEGRALGEKLVRSFA
jgi:dynein heavy chain, axonemal